jgi:hypothetical protein
MRFLALYYPRTDVAIEFRAFSRRKNKGETNQATERGNTYAGITLVLNGARDHGCVMPGPDSSS